MIDLVLVPDPKQRMTIVQIRQHPWFLEGPPAQVRGQSELADAPDTNTQAQIQPSEAEVASAVQVIGLRSISACIYAPLHPAFANC